MQLCVVLWIICFPFLLQLAFSSPTDVRSSDIAFFTYNLQQQSCMHGKALPKRSNTVSLLDFGGVGDGRTLNTQAFQRAISHLHSVASRGGSQLNIPAGKWLTGSFNLTSHFTLFLQKGALILGSQNADDWPLIQPLPSYGQGRERPGPRHSSLIQGQNITDVVITGENGTIDGQGSVWWNMWRTRTLNYTRGHLIELLSSENIIISNIVLQNSPFWTLHPVYCNQVVINGLTILAPPDAPNTDGITPDSSSNVCIEDCYISNGDDLIALKSGWDEYGIAFGKPTSNIIIRRITGTTPNFAGIAFGSEMSGGVRNVFVQDIHVTAAATGIRVKTAAGRGGYISNITISNMLLQQVKRAMQFSADVAEHPDPDYNPDALPWVRGFVLKNITGQQIGFAGAFTGLQKAPFQDICLSAINLMSSPTQQLGVNAWTCTNVEGSSMSVSPSPCAQLQTLNWRSVCAKRVNGPFP